MGALDPALAGGSVSATAGSIASALTEADSEWEYEYDNEQTEDLYFTLDLTTHVPNALRHRGLDGNGRPKKSALPSHAGDARSGGNPTFASGAVGGDMSQDTAGQIQILDLHTKNPLIKFNDGVYSCYWMTDLGTQFHLTSPGVTDSPLRPGNVLDVVGISQARLVGKPVTLTEHQTALIDAEGATSASAIEVDDDVDVESDAEWQPTSETTPLPEDGTNPDQPLVINRDLLKDPSQETQASFIERFAAIKQRKGEKDVVPVISVRMYEPPANQDEIRQKALGPGAEMITEAIGKPPTKKRKRLTFAEMGKTTKAEMAKQARQKKLEEKAEKAEQARRKKMEEKAGRRADAMPSPNDLQSPDRAQSLSEAPMDENHEADAEALDPRLREPR